MIAVGCSALPAHDLKELGWLQRHETLQSWRVWIVCSSGHAKLNLIVYYIFSCTFFVLFIVNCEEMWLQQTSNI